MVKHTGSVRTKSCHYCGKNSLAGRQISHSKRHTLHTQHANLQNVHVLIQGRRTHVWACTRCLRGGKAIKVR